MFKGSLRVLANQPVLTRGQGLNSCKLISYFPSWPACDQQENGAMGLVLFYPFCKWELSDGPLPLFVDVLYGCSQTDFSWPVSWCYLVYGLVLSPDICLPLACLSLLLFRTLHFCLFCELLVRLCCQHCWFCNSVLFRFFFCEFVCQYVFMNLGAFSTLFLMVIRQAEISFVPETQTVIWQINVVK